MEVEVIQVRIEELEHEVLRAQDEIDKLEKRKIEIKGAVREMWRWLDNLKNLPRSRYHLMTNHYALHIYEMYEPNFDITDIETYTAWYFGIDEPYRQRFVETFKAANVDTVFSGHIHCRRPAEIVDGITFYKSAATCFPQFKDKWPDGDPTLGFYHCLVTDDGVEVEFVPLEKESTAEGAWGKGGHVKPEDRDYSLAQESRYVH